MLTVARAVVCSPTQRPCRVDSRRWGGLRGERYSLVTTAAMRVARPRCGAYPSEAGWLPALGR